MMDATLPDHIVREGIKERFRSLFGPNRLLGNQAWEGLDALLNYLDKCPRSELDEYVRAIVDSEREDSDITPGETPA